MLLIPRCRRLENLERGHCNRATLAVARKLTAYLLVVDKSGQPFQLRSLAIGAPALDKAG